MTALSVVENATSRSGARTGSPRSMNASTMANAVVTAPMPTASDPTAMQVNPTRAAQLAHGVAEVLHEILDQAEGEEVVAGFPVERGVAEVPVREAASGVGRDALRGVLLLEQVEMQLELGAKLPILPSGKGRPGANGASA